MGSGRREQDDEYDGYESEGRRRVAEPRWGGNAETYDEPPGTPWDAYATNRGPAGFEDDPDPGLYPEPDDELPPGSRRSKEGGVVAQVGRIGVAALAGLVVADVVLVTLAVAHVRGDETRLAKVSDTPPSASQTAGGPQTKKPTSKPTKSPAEPGIDPKASRTLVDIGQEDAVGRATSGACGSGGGKIEMSSDGGKTFSPSNLESAEVVLRLAVTDADKAKVVVADAKCTTVTTFATENGGGTWFEDDPMTWNKAAAVGAKVHAPEGDVDVPCGDGASVLSLSTLGEQQAYALCSDGTVARSDDGGGSWDKQGTAKDAADLDFVDAENGLAVVTGGSSCAGIAVLKTTDSGKEWAEHGCIETDAKEMADISADGERAYVAAGKAVWFSDDGGETWKEQSK
jgi:hypothetical protein